MIARGNSASLVNERHGLVSNCRQMNKFTLKCFKEQIECTNNVCNKQTEKQIGVLGSWTFLKNTTNITLIH